MCFDVKTFYKYYIYVFKSKDKLYSIFVVLILHKEIFYVSMV